MSWLDIEAFIRARAPRDFWAECAGVSRSDILECERGLGIVLPTLYVGFLQAMGIRSGAYAPFGGHCDHDFAMLVDRMHFAKYPTDRYFKVANHIDDSVDVIEEPFLDLGRSAEDATPLVTIYEGGPFEPEQVYELGSTLEETLCRTAFMHFGMPRRYRVSVSAAAATAEELVLVRDEAAAILGKLGFALVLPPTPHLSCLEGADAAAMIEVHGDAWTVLAVDLGGRDERAVRHVAEVLVDNLPGASY
jgi:hypothetical protein